MVLEIPPDPGQRVVDRDARLGQGLRLTDARQLQQMRRADGAGGDDHFACGISALDSAVA